LAEESGPPPEPAAETDDFDTIVASAVEAYQAQRYDEAIGLFGRAFEIRPQPELIYNIARVYERSVRPREAVEHYERFLSLPNTTAELRARAMTSLEALQMELEAIERANQRVTGGDGTGDGTTPVQPPPPVDPPDALNIAGWVLFGVGVAVLATGGVFGGLSLSEETATEEAGNLEDQQLHFDQGESYALAADVLFGLGGAMALTGAVLLIVRAARGSDDTDEPASAEDVALRPFFGGQGLGLTLGGRF